MRKTIEQAYEELREIIDGGSESFTHEDAVQYLKDKLAQPERHELQAKGEHPAPCARFCEANAFRIAERGYQRQICELSKKLEAATTPPQRKPLTEEEMEKIAAEYWLYPRKFVRAIEAAHGIKEKNT